MAKQHKNFSSNVVWTDQVTGRIGLKIVVQAVKDFAAPQMIPAVGEYLCRMRKDPMYEEIVAKTFKTERKKIIRELRTDFVVMISNGKSEEIASKLQAILDDKTGQSMRQLRKNARSYSITKED